MSDLSSNALSRLREEWRSRVGSQKGQYRMGHAGVGVLLAEIDELIRQRNMWRDTAQDQVEQLKQAQRTTHEPPADAHPEAFCELCGRENACWFAPSEVWNVACGDRNIICPVCFIKLTEAAGIKPTSWLIAPEGYSAQPPPPEWQPIETAPKDGRPFLAIGMGPMFICRWGSGANIWMDQSGQWRDPRLWQHLPEGPCLLPSAYSTATKVVRCNCAGTPPTMPTFRTEHLPTCPCSGLGEPDDAR